VTYGNWLRGRSRKAERLRGGADLAEKKIEQKLLVWAKFWIIKKYDCNTRKETSKNICKWQSGF
jgi:hypothetical protein